RKRDSRTGERRFAEVWARTFLRSVAPRPHSRDRDSGSGASLGEEGGVAKGAKQRLSPLPDLLLLGTAQLVRGRSVGLCRRLPDRPPRVDLLEHLPVPARPRQSLRL